MPFGSAAGSDSASDRQVERSGRTADAARRLHGIRAETFIRLSLLEKFVARYRRVLASSSVVPRQPFQYAVVAAVLFLKIRESELE